MQVLNPVNNRIGGIIAFLGIFSVGLSLRLFYLPYELPLFADGLDNFTYATAINFYGHLPNEWAPANNGWPIFLSFWFSIIDLENSFEYMQMQRVISVVLSSLVTIPIYFLCSKYFDKKISMVGVSLFTFDPRIILNSTLGITEPLFILLGISSLVFFLRYTKKYIILAFILASFTTIVRSEGIFLVLTLSILFFIKYRISKEIVKTYLPALVIFLIILSPIMIYKTEVSGHDGIFQRVVGGTNEIITISNQEKNNEIFAGGELFIKYLGWIMIPSFIFFVPFGIIQFFRKRTKETNFIIVFLVCSSIPILYAYIVQAQDTRYFYFLYPIFCLISLFAVEKYVSKFTKKNIMILLFILGILVSSIFFYEYKKIDYEKENELNQISKIISQKITGINFHPTETKYIKNEEIPQKWPFLFHEMYEIKSVETQNYDNLEEYIKNSKEELSHLVVDDDSKLPEFLVDVFVNEKKYDYLEKVFDSKEKGFKHHLKLFKIDFEKFDVNIEN